MNSFRFSNTHKWADPWFMNLSSASKLVFLYLCDTCDIAGFWEENIKLVALQTGLSEQEVNCSLNELGESYIKIDRWFWLKNFIRNQKNLPLNKDNPAHRGVIKILNSHPKFYKHIESLLSPNLVETPLFKKLEAPTKPLARGLGKGNGNKGGIGGKIKRKIYIDDEGRFWCEGYVYIVQVIDKNLYKIGISAKPYNRIATLERQNKCRLRVIVVIKSAAYVDIEKDLLKEFSSNNVSGEWFELDGLNCKRKLMDLVEIYNKKIFPIDMESEGKLSNETVAALLRQRQMTAKRVEQYQATKQ